METMSFLKFLNNVLTKMVFYHLMYTPYMNMILNAFIELMVLIKNIHLLKIKSEA